MKVGIPFFSIDVGGSSVFANKFSESLRQRGMAVTNDIRERCDILFIMSSAPLVGVWKQRRTGTKIVQRLDGVYYYRVRGASWPIWNAPMAVIHRWLANFVIYQSRFSRQLCTSFLGPTAAPSTIIYNGVDTNRFSPEGERRPLDSKGRKILFTVSVYRRIDMILPLLEAMEVLYRRRQDVVLLVAGTMTDKIARAINRFRNQPYVRWLGRVPNAELPVYERSSDVFVFSDISACPNVIVEALACGLPVVCYDRGGTPELLDSGSAKIVPHGAGEYWKLKLFNAEAFADGIESILANLDESKRRARARALKHYRLEPMVDQYLKIFASLR